MYRFLLGAAALSWSAFIYILWVVFDKAPGIMVAMGVIPVAFFIGGMVSLIRSTLR